MVILLVFVVFMYFCVVNLLIPALSVRKGPHLNVPIFIQDTQVGKKKKQEKRTNAHIGA